MSVRLAAAANATTSLATAYSEAGAASAAITPAKASAVLQPSVACGKGAQHVAASSLQPSWDPSPHRPVPPALKGIKPSTREPWYQATRPSPLHIPTDRTDAAAAAEKTSARLPSARPGSARPSARAGSARLGLSSAVTFADPLHTIDSPSEASEDPPGSSSTSPAQPTSEAAGGGSSSREDSGEWGSTIREEDVAQQPSSSSVQLLQPSRALGKQLHALAEGELRAAAAAVAAGGTSLSAAPQPSQTSPTPRSPPRVLRSRSPVHERLYDERPPSPPRSARRLGDTGGSSTQALPPLGAPDLRVDALVDPSPTLERRLGASGAHDARVARITSVNSLQPAPSRVNTTHQFKPETVPRVVFPREPPPQQPQMQPRCGGNGGDGGEEESLVELLPPGSPTVAPFRSCGAQLWPSTAAQAASSSAPGGGGWGMVRAWWADSMGAVAGGGAAAGGGAVAAASSAEGGGEAAASEGDGEEGEFGEAAGGADDDGDELDAEALDAHLRDAAPFAFGEPPAWLVAAAAEGCHTLAEVAARTSLEHQGPIDALEQNPQLLAEYSRWLLHASKRVDYLKERQRETRREQAVSAHRAEHARHGAALQRAAWRQRGAAVEERQRVVALNQAKARHGKREAEVRKQEKRWRENRRQAYVQILHSEVAELPEDVREARAQLTSHRQAGARTLRAAAGAIERRRSELQMAKESEARAVRDRVRAAGIVQVPPHVAATIERSASFGRSSSASMPNSARVLRTPDSVLTLPKSLSARAPRARPLDDTTMHFEGEAEDAELIC